MSVTLFKDVSYTLSRLMQDIAMGEIGLPEIQRPFVWPNTKVRDLFDSMYRGFPIGYLLFWANGSGDGHRQIGTDAKQKVPKLLIVDGQQRLTSLYAVMRGVEVVRANYEKERIAIAFNPVTEKFEVPDAAIRRDHEFIVDISALWSEHSDMFELADDYVARLETYRTVTPAERKAIRKAINNLYNVQSYPFCCRLGSYSPRCRCPSYLTQPLGLRRQLLSGTICSRRATSQRWALPRSLTPTR